jgi:hypothetical protein
MHKSWLLGCDQVLSKYEYKSFLASRKKGYDAVDGGDDDYDDDCDELVVGRTLGPSSKHPCLTR